MKKINPTLAEKLSALAEQGGLRTRQPMVVSGVDAQRGGSEQALVNFSSNDYLGLAGDAELQHHFLDECVVGAGLDASGFEGIGLNLMSASSSRALTGTSLFHEELETSIAASYKKDSALLFNSGYHANTGILPALTSSDDLLIADKLVHASIIDGLRLGSADFKRFAHNDLVHLRSLLEKYREQYQNVWIVTESVFSMDGDIAPLKDIVALKKEFDAYLYVDEAHAVGCLGEAGLGVAEQEKVIADVDILVGVFGKALASTGAFAVANQPWIDGLVNYSRSWLFSTALPPLNTAWNLFIWQQLPEFNVQREQLSQLTNNFRSELEKQGSELAGESYIVPFIKGSNEQVLDLSKYLERKGFLAMPIRSPTVKAGSERVRFSLTANIPQQDIDELVVAIAGYSAN